MKHTTTTLGLIGAVALLGACAQLEQAAKTNASSVSSMAIVAEGCTAQLSGVENAAGIIAIQLVNDHKSGTRKLLGKAFVAKEALPVDVYVLLGQQERSKAERMKIRKGIALDFLGPRIDVAIGLSAVSSPVVSPNREQPMAAVRAQYGAVSNVAADGSKLVMSLQQSPKHPGFYLADSSDNLGPITEEPVSSAAAEGTGEQAATLRSSIGTYRSFTVNAQKLGRLAVNIPVNPEPAGNPFSSGVAPDKDGNLVLQLAGDPNTSQATRLLVQFEEFSAQPTWRASCYRPDVAAGGGPVTIPAKWKNSKTDKEEAISGTFVVTVTRATKQLFKVSDPDRIVIMDVHSGFRTLGTAGK